MQTVNDYDREVFNGDLGTVVGLTRRKARSLSRSRPGGQLSVRRTRHPGSGLRDHHPQVPGFGIPRCRHPGRDAALTMLARNLLYTGVTRGKRLVVLVGQKRAIAIAVRGGQMKRRWTKLREWLS